MDIFFRRYATIRDRQESRNPHHATLGKLSFLRPHSGLEGFPSVVKFNTFPHSSPFLWMPVGVAHSAYLAFWLLPATGCQFNSCHGVALTHTP